MPVERRRIARSLALFGAIMALGGLPWPAVALGFSAAYCPVIDVLIFDRVTFGQGGHARLVPLSQLTTRPDDNVSADTALLLKVDGFEGDLSMGLSLRRDVYLPLLIVAGVILAAPGSARSKGRNLLVGISVVAAYSAAALCLVVLWTFAVRMRGVYDLSSFSMGALDLAHRTLLLPPGNRFLVPFVVGGGLLWWPRPRNHKASPVA